MIDAEQSGVINALDAARFLKKSNLSDIILSRIWDLSDPKGTGQLNKIGFFVALKLIALQQQGEVASLNILYKEVNDPPKCGDIPKKVLDTLSTISFVPVESFEWSLSIDVTNKYETIFESMSPQNGLISGNKVRDKMIESNLPVNVLGKIWDLADQDKDGNLNQHEFTVAFHLINIALEKKIVPNQLPDSLKPNKLNSFVAIFPEDLQPPQNNHDHFNQQDECLNANNEEWVINTNQKNEYNEIFKKYDTDHDGFVNGSEIKEIFLKSSLSQKILADIWALCDNESRGKLDSEQFALAMWLIKRKCDYNLDPPRKLCINMIPPTHKLNIEDEKSSIEKYINPELRKIFLEVQKLEQERKILENEVAQKEANMKIKNGEARSLEVR